KGAAGCLSGLLGGAFRSGTGAFLLNKIGLLCPPEGRCGGVTPAGAMAALSVASNRALTCAYAGSNLDRENFTAAIKHRPRIRLTIRHGHGVLEQWREKRPPKERGGLSRGIQ